MAFGTPRLIAGGNVNPFRLITPSVSADHTGSQAGANDPIIGASGGGTKFAPLNDLVTTNLHAAAGDQIELRGPGEEAMVAAGAAIAAGTRFKSDANGKAVAAATTGTTNQQCGGWTQQAAAAEDELIRVLIDPEVFRPALS
jgi:hypothetical protein